MKSISCLFFLVLILAIWPRRILTHDVGDNKSNVPDDVITEACAKTPYKDLCISSIKDDDESPGSADLHDVARIAVKIAWINASDAQYEMKKMLNSTSASSIQHCLMDCDATYDDAVANLEESASAFDSKGYGDIVAWVAASMVDPQTCEDYFKDIPGYTSPVTRMNNVVMQLCSNALALTKLVADGQN